ncbi:MAG: TerC family protein [Armatimonadetes bacterium]|nr:TerC family protein [Armatimonadota bacterium]
MDWITDPSIWAAFLTLTVLEIVLGIDNIVFISIVSSKLPEGQQAKARQVGLSLALIMRILLLLSLTWIMRLETDLFAPFGHGFSGRDLILLGGGLFLIYKAVMEIHGKLEGEEHGKDATVKATFSQVIATILVLDIVFSLDSVITAIGMAKQIGVMVAAIVVAVIVMLIFATPVSNFVERHPTVKMLALSFLVLIGVNLIAEGFGQHIPKGYTYFAMAFAIGVEMLNLRVRPKVKPLKLRSDYSPE